MAEIAHLDPARERMSQIAARGLVAAQELADAVWGDLAVALDVAEQLRRLTDAITGHLLNEIDLDGRWALDGQRSIISWVQVRTGEPRVLVQKQVARAKELRAHLPLTSEALDHGRIAAAHADHIIDATTTSPRRREALKHDVVGEHWLVENAGNFSADRLRMITREWAARADPEAEDRAFREASDRNELSLGRTRGGWHMTGWFDEERGLTLATAIEAAIGVVPEGDARSRAQRNADALHTLVKEELDAGTLQKGAKIRPHLLVHVPFATMTTLVQTAASSVRNMTPREKHSNDENSERQERAEVVIPGNIPDYQSLVGQKPATLSDGTPIAPSQLMHFLCDSDITRVVFGASSEPLDVGRKQRLHTTHQRIAIIARDKHCQYQSCTLPPLYCEPHHAQHWSRGGKTNVDDAILLCWTHHRVVHTHHLTIERYPDRWEYRKQDGAIHSIVPRHTDAQLL